MTASERAAEWLRFAQDDLRSAEVLLKEKIFNEVCFHSQQCAEKAMKALIVAKGDVVPKTHRLVDLFELVIKYHKLQNIRTACLVLDQYYIPTRYPDAVIGSSPTGIPIEKEARESLDLAHLVFSESEALL